jgi:hypothetical protein
MNVATVVAADRHVSTADHSHAEVEVRIAVLGPADSDALRA